MDKLNETENIDKTEDKLIFSPIAITENEGAEDARLLQLNIDNELQKKVKNNENIYESELSKLKEYGMTFDLKGNDPVGINGVVFVPYVTYTIGNRIVSPEGIQLITYDIMQSVLSADSTAIVSENKIKEEGGGTMEITEHGGVILQTTKT